MASSSGDVRIRIDHFRNVEALFGSGVPMPKINYRLDLEDAYTRYFEVADVAGESLDERWRRVAARARELVREFLTWNKSAPSAEYIVTETPELAPPTVTWTSVTFDEVRPGRVPELGCDRVLRAQPTAP